MDLAAKKHSSILRVKSALYLVITYSHISKMMQLRLNHQYHTMCYQFALLAIAAKQSFDIEEISSQAITQFIIFKHCKITFRLR